MAPGKGLLKPMLVTALGLGGLAATWACFPPIPLTRPTVDRSLPRPTFGTAAPDASASPSTSPSEPASPVAAASPSTTPSTSASPTASGGPATPSAAGALASPGASASPSPAGSPRS